MNLTRIRRVDDVVRLHYCESLFLASLLPSGALRVADVGSGPGFPGIPIAIMRPECQVTLIESNKRKAVFLSEASRELTNIKVLPFRAHDIEEKFDWTVSRAVSAGEVLSLRLSGNIALLVSAADVPAGWSIYEVPWTKGHYVARFHVEQA